MYNVLALLPILFFINLIEENDFLAAEEEKDKEGDGEGERGKTKKKKRDNERKKKKKKKGTNLRFYSCYTSQNIYSASNG